MKLTNSLRAVMLSSSLLCGTSAIAVPVTLQIDGIGILTGAKNVEVGGFLYDVAFVDGSCNSLFNGCTTPFFAFHNRTDALLASQALLDQVFLDGPLGQFDSDPTKTFGCGERNLCVTDTPYLTTTDIFGGRYGMNGRVWNWSSGSGNADSRDFIGISASVDYATQNVINYALFKRATSNTAPIPEPGSLALIGLALGGMAFLQRRKN